LHLEGHFTESKIIGTSSAQLSIALAMCALLRKRLNLSNESVFASTGSLDPLGFITYVSDLQIKRSVEKDIVLIDGSKYMHLFDVLKAVNFLENR
jgi:hypothetical protein